MESEFFKSEEDTYADGLTFLAEHFQRFLADHDSYGVIVLDSRRRDVERPHASLLRAHRGRGDRFRQLDRLVNSLLLGPPTSRSASLPTLVSRRKVAHAPGDASRWFKQLGPRFARHPVTGEVEGVGLKVYPPPVKGEDPGPTKLFWSRVLQA